jgi:hypothetical protein
VQLEIFITCRRQRCANKPLNQSTFIGHLIALCLGCFYCSWAHAFRDLSSLKGPQFNALLQLAALCTAPHTLSPISDILGQSSPHRSTSIKLLGFDRNCPNIFSMPSASSHQTSGATPWQDNLHGRYSYLEHVSPRLDTGINTIFTDKCHAYGWAIPDFQIVSDRRGRLALAVTDRALIFSWGLTNRLL